VFLTAGHCVAADDEGNVVASARIWFEQDAGADYDPATGAPATSSYPYTGGVTSTRLFNYGLTDLSTIPETQDVGLIVLDAGAVEAKYPEIDTYANLAPVGAADLIGTGIDAVVEVSGYGVTRTVGRNGRTRSPTGNASRAARSSSARATRTLPATTCSLLRIPAAAGSARASATPAAPCWPATRTP
jgi:hypothetical protein